MFNIIIGQWKRLSRGSFLRVFARIFVPNWPAPVTARSVEFYVHFSALKPYGLLHPTLFSTPPPKSEKTDFGGGRVKVRPARIPSRSGKSPQIACGVRKPFPIHHRVILMIGLTRCSLIAPPSTPGRKAGRAPDPDRPRRGAEPAPRQAIPARPGSSPATARRPRSPLADRRRRPGG
jgi:hypothetical protein